MCNHLPCTNHSFAESGQGSRDRYRLGVWSRRGRRAQRAWFSLRNNGSPFPAWRDAGYDRLPVKARLCALRATLTASRSPPFGRHAVNEALWQCFSPRLRFAAASTPATREGSRPVVQFLRLEACLELPVCTGLRSGWFRSLIVAPPFLRYRPALSLPVHGAA